MSSPILAALAEARQIDTERRVRSASFEYPPRPRRGLGIRHALVELWTPGIPATRQRRAGAFPRHAH